jgi:hypothetical protein
MINFYGCNFFFNSENVDMKLSELPALLAEILDQLVKAKAEIVGKIEELEEAMTVDPDVELSQEAQDLLVALRGKAQALDDIVPDAAVEPIEPEDPVDPEEPVDPEPTV